MPNAARTRAMIKEHILAGDYWTATTVAADVLAIPITHGYVVKTTGADAESLTLADGSYEGQRLVITLGTDGGGDGTLTPTTKTGFTSIVFADAGDIAVLRWVNSTVGWVQEFVSTKATARQFLSVGTNWTATTVDADALVIPVTHAYVVKTTGGDAEALSLADGTYEGQQLTITLGTDGGGTGTLTPTTKTGFATIAFADAGDTAVLRFINSTVGWVIEALYGVSAPPAITV